jgi:hypothetical protein
LVEKEGGFIDGGVFEVLLAEFAVVGREGEEDVVGGDLAACSGGDELFDTSD